MGAWGTGIFEDDLASEVRDEYFELIESLLPVKEATKTIIESFQEELEDSEESNVFWLSLAAIQLDNNNLSEVVKEKALDIINSGTDLERWINNPKLYSSRKDVLEQLKRQLLLLQ